MHRQISHADQAFHQERRLGLYVLTALIGVLIAADLWPVVAEWSAARGIALPSWPREFQPGYRIALLAAILGGVRVVYSSIESLMQGKVGADLALAIACVAAIAFQKPLVAAEIVFIGMVGECLEAITFDRTQRALRRLVEVAPRRAWLLRDGHEVEVPIRDLRAGDRVVVKPGGRVPVDGVVVEGASTLDVSALTGESLPVERRQGDEVLAGSVNQLGALVVETRRIAEHTVVGQVIELTAHALKHKAPLERTADRLARYFLPVVLGLAAATFLAALLLNLGIVSGARRSLGEAISRSVDPTLAVLVVACPCALILATPAAIIAALGRLAGTGILIKSGKALEALADVSAVAFDKTGTLTEGRLVLGEVIAVQGVAADDVVRSAAAAEEHSEHPLARLISAEARQRGLAPEPVEDFRASPGAGVTARTAAGVLVVGTRRHLEEQGVALSEETLAALDGLEKAGQTSLVVARGGAVLGVIGARDALRPEAAMVVKELRRLGIGDIALLTGDRPAVAEAVARAVGINDVHAGLLPQEKAEFIARWTTGSDGAPPRKSAMVGDGINDAPALARADVGLAVGGSGTDVAAEAGDVVFMGDPLRHLPLLVRLSRATVHIIRQNILIFAFGVNAVGIVLTAWLWPLLATSPEWYERAPLAAVIYHQFGSLAVLLNAMRLLWFERRLSHPAWHKTRQAFAEFDHWLGHWSTHRVEHWLVHHRRQVFGLAALGLVLAYAMSGMTQVGPDEVAVVRRFGRPIEPVLEPGLHWRWPWPVEAVDRVQPERIRGVEVGFRSLPSAPQTTELTWTAAHTKDLVRVPDEAVMITGDGNLVELQATVRYCVDRAHLVDYLYAIRDPDEVLRAAAESVLRATVAGRPFLDLLTTTRGRLADDVLARLQERCRDMDGLGIRVQGLTVQDLHPPQEVVPAYHDVARAMEARDRQVNEAEADRIRQKRAARAQAEQIVHEAEAAARELVRSAEAARARFWALCEARTALDRHDEWRLVGETLGAVLVGLDAKTAARAYERRRGEQLSRQASLTEFRLFWEALSAALAGREKIIIDADRVSGRRQLFLADPDKLRMPIPALTQPGRNAPERGPRPEDSDDPRLHEKP
jgi:Cu+-exporting ATPase